MTDGVWATFHNEQDLLAFDLDLPGRNLAHVQDRLMQWVGFMLVRPPEQRVSMC